VKVLVLADTHIPAGGTDRLPREVWKAAASADRILHAGDVTSKDLLDALESHAPVTAVLGNNDLSLRGVLPETVEVELDGCRVAMVHDSGARAGRPARVHRWFPEAAVVVYGHSHLPDDSLGVDGQLLFNPGSSTQRRRAPYRTYGWLELDGGRVVAHRIIPID
jgi:putative phosphoesterase